MTLSNMTFNMDQSISAHNSKLMQHHKNTKASGIKSKHKWTVEGAKYNVEIIAHTQSKRG